MYHLSLLSSRILVLFYWADVVKLRIFQPLESAEMFTMLFYKKEKSIVIFQHFLSTHRMLGVEYHYSGGRKNPNSHRFFYVQITSLVISL